jgi:hypothetical protein
MAKVALTHAIIGRSLCALPAARSRQTALEQNTDYVCGISRRDACPDDVAMARQLAREISDGL